MSCHTLSDESSIWLLQQEWLTNLAVEGCRQASSIMFIHTHPPIPVQPQYSWTALSLAEQMQQLQVTAAAHGSGMLAPLYDCSKCLFWMNLSEDDNNPVSTCLRSFIPKSSLSSARYYGFQWCPNFVQWAIRLQGPAPSNQRSSDVTSFSGSTKPSVLPLLHEFPI